MSAIALGRVSGVLTLAVVRRFGFLCREHGRRKACPFMLAIAKGLVLGQTTGAISVLLSFFDFDLFRETGCDFWLVHERFFFEWIVNCYKR